MTPRLVCTFSVGDLLLGIDAAAVQEVLHGQTEVPVPLAPPGVAGLVNLRGEILTSVDSRARLGLAAAERASAAHVVVRTDREAVAMRVDREGEVVDVADDGVEEVPPTVRESIREVMTGAYGVEGGLLLLLDAARFLDLGVGTAGAK